MTFPLAHKKTTLVLAGLLSIAIVAGTLQLYSSSRQSEYAVDDSDMYAVDPQTTVGKEIALSESEKEWLVMMREEEKLARDVYTTLGMQWNTRIFSNIAASEQTHTDAIKTLLTRYSIDDPVKDDTVGVFTSPTMQQLYIDLTSQGKISELEALKVGSTIEDLDIRDLDTAQSVTTHTDVVQVYANLQKGSRNHLRAFVQNITRSGGTYTPAYISQSAFDAIIGGTQERGRQ